MPFVNRRARNSIERAPSHGYLRPNCEGLEDRVLLSIDLGLFTPPNNPNIAVAPYGFAFGGSGTVPGVSSTFTSQGAGTAVADVGDLTGDGYEDVAIASPGNKALGQYGYVSVIMGSNTLPAGTIQNWIGSNNATPPVYNYNADNRVGDLNELGSATQTNPITGATPTYPFSGLTFTDLINPIAGFSAVAGVNFAGHQALLIGAPGGLDANNANAGTGRVYLIYGNFNSYVGQTIDLGLPSSTLASMYPNLTFVTFVSTATLGALGTSVAGGVNIFGDGSADIIMGAPEASTGATVNSGAVYVVPTSAIPSGNQTINVTTVGQSGGIAGLILAGANSGDRLGFAVTDAGDVNGAVSGTTNIDDLLLGAPQSGASDGNTYLVYGGSTLRGLATTTSGVSYINVNRVGTINNGTIVPGATFTGATAGALTGFSVSSAGPFTGNGLSDILIGAPGYASTTTNVDEGAVYIFYGAPSTSGAYLTGTIPLSTIPSVLPAATITGADPGDMAGTSVSLMGVVNAGQPNNILIGAPGYAGSAGTVYLIPGRTTPLTGTLSLANAGSNPINALQFVSSQSAAPSTSPALFGTSVSGRLQTTTNTIDADDEGDFIVGAPGYDVTQNVTRANAGGALVVQGGLITVPVPVTNQVTVQIGVGTPFAPFSISATTPANLPIYVFGSTTTTPNFMPVADINPATIVVNGVAFPNATLQQDPDTGNYLDGIPDAIITINPRSALNLPTGVDVITITGQTLSTSPLPNFTFTGTATVTVTGGSVTPVIALVAGVPRGPDLETTFISPYGANQYTPSLTSLSTFNYQPIPVSVALQQFLVPQGFRQRIYSYNHPGKTIGPYLTSRGQNKGRATAAQPLSSSVFNRSRFHASKTYAWTHKGPKVQSFGIVPLQEKRQRFDDNLLH